MNQLQMEVPQFKDRREFLLFYLPIFEAADLDNHPFMPKDGTTMAELRGNIEDWNQAGRDEAERICKELLALQDQKEKTWDVPLIIKP